MSLGSHEGEKTAAWRDRGESESRWPWRPDGHLTVIPGVISMTTNTDVSGSTAKWMLHAARCRRPTSRRRRCPNPAFAGIPVGQLIAGGQVTEFDGVHGHGSSSIEHTTTTRVLPSRISSSSNSFQP